MAIKHIQLPITLLITLFVFQACGSTKSLTADKNTKATKLDQSVEVQVERLFLDANKAKLIEDDEEAIKLFLQVLELDPNNSAAQYELARLFYHEGNSFEALKYSKSAVKLEPDNKWYKLLYADILALENRPKEAADVYSEILEDNDEDLELYYEWAYLLIQSNQLKEAVEVYDKLEQKIGLDPDMIYQKQKIYLELNDLESAAAEIQKLIDAYPNVPDYYGVLAELYEANGETEKAIQLYNKILELDPNNPAGLIALADLSLKDGDRETYMKNMKLIFADPNMDIDVKIRVIYNYLQNYEEGSDEVLEAIELTSILAEAHPEDPKAHALVGDVYYMDNQYEEALKAYFESLKYAQDVFTVWQNIMIIQSELNLNESLVSTSQEAMELFPLQPISYLFNGTSLYQMKKYEEALKPFHKGAMVTIENLRLKAQFYSNMGDVFHELKDHASSDSSYDESLKHDPNNAYVLNNYAYYLSLRGENLDKAAEMSLRSNQIDENSAAFQDTYAWILYKQGKYKDAKEWQLKALQNGGEDRPVLLEHYGDILFKLGDVNGAVEYWQKSYGKGIRLCNFRQENC